MNTSIVASTPAVCRANGVCSRDRLGQHAREAFGRARSSHHDLARLVDARVVRRVRPVVVPIVGGLDEDVRLEGSGDDDGDAQSERRDLSGQRFSPAFERPLGGGVGADRRHATHRALARDDDDPTASGCAHGGQQRSRELDGPEQIGGEDLRPRAARHVLEAACCSDPGVVHEDVGCTDRRFDGLRRFGDRRRVVQVELHAEQARIVGACTGLRAQALEPRVDRTHGGDHPPPELVEMRCGRETEPARRTGDDDAPRRGYCAGPLHMPSAFTGLTFGRPSGWPVAHVLQ